MVRMSVEERRRLLIQAAIAVIARDGVAAVTARAVVAEAGVPLAGLHYVFDSMDDLLAAVVREVTEQERLAAVRSMLTEDAPVRPVPPAPGDVQHLLTTVIRDGLELFLAELEADPQREQAVLEVALYAARTGQRAALDAQYQLYLDAATSLLAIAAERTGARWRVPLTEVAAALVLVTDGLTVSWLTTRDTTRARQSAGLAAAALAQLAQAQPTPEETDAHSD